MNPYDFNNKTFYAVQNSENGTVNSDTVFKYKQDGNLVTADYHGGAIHYGKIIAHLRGDKLHMLYQCLTTEGELKAGKAIASISIINEKLNLKLDWEWLDADNKKGKSEYIEV